jgi:ketosteroid isomerase-like protein
MILCVAFLLLVQVGGQGPSSLVDALDARFVHDLHDKKIDDVLTLYTSNSVFVQPDGTQVIGPGLRKLYEQVTTALDNDLHLKRTSLKHNLNTIVEDGTYTETLRHHGTGKVDDVKGTYRFTMHRDADGQWRYVRMEWH